VACVGTSNNIGIGGLFLAVDRRFSVGDRFTLEFTLPNHIHPMSVDAEVRWIRAADERPAGIGMRFLNPPIGAMVALYDLLRRTDLERSVG
jgi:Tfp pilus assembly protein PilZ